MISMMLNPGFSFFGIWEIKWYGVIIAFAMVMGMVAAIFTSKAKGYNKGIVLDVAIAAIPLALVGARLYYVIFYGVNSFWEIFEVWNGGMAIYGGVIGGFLGIVIVSKVKKVPILDLCDIAAPCLILGQAIGRWGNFVNQEAYGALITNPSFQWFPFGVYIDSSNFTSDAINQIESFYGTSMGVDGAWFNATFFYESFWNLIGFVVLMMIVFRIKIPGIVTSCYFIYYGIGRAIIEGFRTDSLYLWNSSIRVSQALSILLVIGGIVMLSLCIWYYKKHPRTVTQASSVLEIEKVDEKYIEKVEVPLKDDKIENDSIDCEDNVKKQTDDLNTIKHSKANKNNNKNKSTNNKN